MQYFPFYKNKKITTFHCIIPHMKAIILAAGKGTRLRPITDTVPKVMVQVAWKPLLEYNMEHLAPYVDEFIIVVKYKQEVIRDYFGASFHDIPITYHEQVDESGTGAALWWIETKGDIFIVTSDQIFNQKDVDRLAKSSGYGALAKSVSNPEKYGIFQTDADGNMIDIIEKPKDYVGNLASVLYFKVNDEVLEEAKHIEPSERGEYELIAPIQNFAKKHRFKIRQVQYPFLDITSVRDLENANLNILNLEKPPLWESIFLEDFTTGYELHVWVPTKTIDHIIEHSRDESDQALARNTGDKKRFLSRETFTNWYHDSGRYVFSLLEKNGTIAGIWFGRPSEPPELAVIENTELAHIIETHENNIHTGGIRLYQNARGKWLATPLIERSSYYYRQIFPDAYMSIDIDSENIPSQKAYLKAGYQYVGLGENHKTIDKNPEHRLVYIDIPHV